MYHSAVSKKLKKNCTLPEEYRIAHQHPPRLDCLGVCGGKAPDIKWSAGKWMSLHRCDQCQDLAEERDRLGYKQTPEYKEKRRRRAELAGLSVKHLGVKGTIHDIPWYRPNDPGRPEGQTMAYLWGPCGTGKTTSLVMWIRVAIARGWSCKLVTEGEFLESLRPLQGRRPAMTLGDWDSKYTFVAFDEIGQHGLTAWASDAIRDFVDLRYRSQKPTAFSSNIKLDDIAKGPLGERVSSRIYEMTRPNRVIRPGYDFRTNRKV